MATPTTPLVWLITGCSSGFGFALSVLALKAGHKVIATSRNPSKTPELLQQIEELGGIWIVLDTTSPVTELRKAVEHGKNQFGRIDVLVNNAGVGIIGALEDVNPDEAHQIFETNVFGPLNLMQAVLPEMRSRRSGVIVNISSAAGLNPRPSMGIYGASKWALEGLSQSLAQEVAPLGIRVLIIQPGAFTTNMLHAVTTTSKPLTADYHETEVGTWYRIFEGENRDFKSPNDVQKGCQGIFEAVTGTGRAGGKTDLVRMPLSSDAAERTIEHIARLQAGYDGWKAIWESTGHDGGVSK